MTHTEFAKHLAAFADGDTDDVTRLRVMRYLAAHPEAMARVIEHQQFRHAVARVVRASTPPTPAGLRDRIASLPVTTSPRSNVVGRIGRWAAAITAVAAVLVLATMLGLPSGEQPWLHWPPGAAQIVPAGMAGQFINRHVACTRMLADLEDQAAFPHTLEQMPETLAARLHSAPGDLTGLDLRKAGYVFERAGLCHVPGKSVHLIYRALPETGRNDQISVWIQSAADSRIVASLEEGRVYRAGPRDSAHPLVVWKRGGMLFFVVGDGQPSVDAAADVLRGA